MQEWKTRKRRGLRFVSRHKASALRFETLTTPSQHRPKLSSPITPSAKSSPSDGTRSSSHLIQLPRLELVSHYHLYRNSIPPSSARSLALLREHRADANDHVDWIKSLRPRNAEVRGFRGSMGSDNMGVRGSQSILAQCPDDVTRCLTLRV